MIALTTAGFFATVLKWTVALGLGAVLVEVIRSFTQRKQMGATVAKTFTDAAVTLVGPLQDRVRSLETEIGVLRLEVEECLDRERHSSSDSSSS